ncbi:MAG: hypothetical protein RPU34_10965 [Candidatus Sedimenticola sp. (ex Thyasira tokunagai)]
MNKIALIIILTCSSAFAGDDKVIFDVSRFPDSGLMRMKTSNGYVLVVKRSHEAIAKLESQKHPIYEEDPGVVKNIYRSIRKDLFVTYSPCRDGSQLSSFDLKKGFVCSDCAKYDLAGVPMNECAGKQPSVLPEHYYSDEKTLVLPK